jgi:hypothetical protein
MNGEREEDEEVEFLHKEMIKRATLKLFLDTLSAELGEKKVMDGNWIAPQRDRKGKKLLQLSC